MFLIKSINKGNFKKTEKNFLTLFQLYLLSMKNSRNEQPSETIVNLLENLVDIIKNDDLSKNYNCIMEVILMIQDMINACTELNEFSQVYGPFHITLKKKI